MGENSLEKKKKEKKERKRRNIKRKESARLKVSRNTKGEKVETRPV